MEGWEHDDIESFCKKYGFTAILGFICTLLMCGKFLHHAFSRRNLIFGAFIVPPAMIAGILGLIWFAGNAYKFYSIYAMW